MKNVELEEKLTPAAKQAIDELVEDYKNRILLGSKESASSRTGEIQEISVYDILASVNRNQVRRVSSPSRNIEFILRLYIMVGFAIGAVGIFYFMYMNVFKILDLREQLPLLITMTGLLMSAVSYMYMRLRQSREAIRSELQEMRDDRKAAYSMFYIKRWQDIELAARSVVASRLGESSAKEPIALLISKLRQDEVLNLDDEARLKEFLILRNKILHEGIEINREEFEQADKDAGRILAKMVSRP